MNPLGETEHESLRNMEHIMNQLVGMEHEFIKWNKHESVRWNRK
jgi:hypothetical protein